MTLICFYFIFFSVYPLPSQAIGIHLTKIHLDMNCLKTDDEEKCID